MKHMLNKPGIIKRCNRSRQNSFLLRLKFEKFKEIWSLSMILIYLCCEWDLGLKCSWLSYLLSEVYAFIPAMKKKKCNCSPMKKFLYIWSGVEYEYTPWSGMAWKNIMFHENISINRPTHLRCLVAKFSSSIALCWNWKQYLWNHYIKNIC